MSAEHSAIATGAVSKIPAELEQLSVRGLTASFGKSPDDGWNKLSACLDIDSDVKLSQLLLWDGGEAQVQIADVVSGEMFQQHREITSRAELEAVLEFLLDQL